MSRIGRMPIQVPGGVEVEIGADSVVRVKGPKGELSQRVPSRMTVKLEDGVVTVTRPDEAKESKALHGLTRTLIANMVEGVTNGYRKTLEITGVGYRAARADERLTLQVGFSHPVQFFPPAGIAFEVETPTRFHVVGIDKALVGEVAAQVRRVRPPEPYLGKGIRYAGERVRRKAGKAGKVGARA
jgi:large subunit ribosomal protein L6